MIVAFTDGNFQNQLAVDMMGKSIGQCTGVSPGDQVEVSFSISSTNSNGRWFTNAKGYRIDKMVNGVPSKIDRPEPPPQPSPQSTRKPSTPSPGVRLPPNFDFDGE
jgi:hypothetical protein